MGVGDNPNTVLSYGILANYITRATARKFQWNFIVNGYTHGAPEIYQHWIKWSSGKNEVERDSKHVPNLIKKIHPDRVLPATLSFLDHYFWRLVCLSRSWQWIDQSVDQSCRRPNHSFYDGQNLVSGSRCFIFSLEGGRLGSHRLPGCAEWHQP